MLTCTVDNELNLFPENVWTKTGKHSDEWRNIVKHNTESADGVLCIPFLLMEESPSARNLRNETWLFEYPFFNASYSFNWFFLFYFSFSQLRDDDNLLWK